MRAKWIWIVVKTHIRFKGCFSNPCEYGGYWNDVSAFLSESDARDYRDKVPGSKLHKVRLMGDLFGE